MVCLKIKLFFQLLLILGAISNFAIRKLINSCIPGMISGLDLKKYQIYTKTHAIPVHSFITLISE